MKATTAAWILGLGALGGVLALLRMGGASAEGKAESPPAHDTKESAPMVRVRVFDAAGKLVGPIETPKVVKSDADWKKSLSDAQYRIARGKGTERPFCGLLLKQKEAGVYACVCCGLPLFSSDAKFESGTGWPSFFQPIADENVIEHADRSFGMERTEILCARCDAHLGHVFDDGPKPTGRRHCLNSESLTFTPARDLAKLADPAAKRPAGDARAQAVFAGGCFWCTEAVFEQLDGVFEVESGYAGGDKAAANYEDVCGGGTGHAEAIRITYLPDKISYDKLLEVFFDTHDPTQLNRQGPDAGTQYRSAVFYADEQQKQAAERRIAELTTSKKFDRPIATTLEPLKEFYTAEQYHQDFARRHPEHPYIRQQTAPKLEKLRQHFPENVRKSPASAR